MDTRLAIASKRDTRRYQPTQLPDVIADGILQAGRVTGSAKNRQGRRFVVLLDSRTGAAPLVTRPENVRSAALVIAIVSRKSPFAAFDAGRAAQNMMLWAWNEGVASCPNAIADAVGIGLLLDLDHTEEEVTVLLSFGLPNVPIESSRRSVDQWLSAADRLPLDELVEYR